MTTSISHDNTTIKNLDDKQLREMIVEAAQNKKAKGITVINLESIESAPAREFIVAEGRTPQQVAAIADNIR